ncbi:hypothetical protein SANA_15670 [Gottschalkiaceae bacterium SANA]|nr:hypothetical protein SANA_15670 [Gottschalkiaceae bacterium SANA]
MIEVKNLTFQYENAKSPTLKDLSFSLIERQILVVVGPSGGGKSTLLRLLAGLEEPSYGEIQIDSKIMVNKKTFVPAEKRGIGMLFQDYALFPHLTVEKNIAFGLNGLSRKQRKERVKKMLQLVELEEYGNRYPHELSGGQQQRVALARALAPAPKVLFLDEPFSNLDTELLVKVRNDLFSIVKKSGITTIMVSHNPEDAEVFADQVIRIPAL